MHPKRVDARRGAFDGGGARSRNSNQNFIAYKLIAVSVLCPPGAVDVDAIESEEDAMRAIERYSDEEVGFLQTFNIHRDNYVAGEDHSSTMILRKTQLCREIQHRMGSRNARGTS